MTKHCDHFLALEKHFPALAGDGWRGFVRRRLASAMALPRVRAMLDEFHQRIHDGGPVFEAFLEVNRITPDAEGVVEAIPESGSAVVVANHPFGGADAAVMAALACRRRSDARVLANAELLDLPGMADWLFPLHILGGAGADRANVATLRRAMGHLRDGGLLVIFPAGAVAHWQWHSARVEDPPWPGHAARLVRKSGAPVLPVRFFGANPPWFQLLGALHPLVRSALIPRAFLSMAGGSVCCRAGELLTGEGLPDDPEALTKAMRTAVERVTNGAGK